MAFYVEKTSVSVDLPWQDARTLSKILTAGLFFASALASKGLELLGSKTAFLQTSQVKNQFPVPGDVLCQFGWPMGCTRTNLRTQKIVLALVCFTRAGWGPGKAHLKSV